MRRFNPTSDHPVRAVQAWQIRVGAAMNRQTLTYKGQSVLMYSKEAAGVLDRILGHVAYYCIDNSLPPLTAIVVGKGRGTPGKDIPIDLGVLDFEREAVYDTNWYDIYPPTAEQLAEAYALHSAKKRA